MKSLWRSYTFFTSLGVTVLLFASFGGKRNTAAHTQVTPAGTEQTAGAEAVAQEGLVLPQIITSIDLSRDYVFAGEVVPKGNFDAMERLDRELSVNSYWHSSTLLNIKASNRYFAIIEPILAAHGVPDDFKYLAVAESNLRNETSPAGAKGVWQFLKSTGEHYGLEVNSDIDERYHIEKATEAACRYLKDYHKQFGSWTLAAAAYNMGGPRVKNLLAEQKVNNYYDLNLNEETSRYVFRIIAIKEILKSPEAFGFYVQDKDRYLPLKYRTVTVNGPVTSWPDFAIEHGTTYRILKVYNPWLIGTKLVNKAGKQYEIKIPEV